MSRIRLPIWCVLAALPGLALALALANVSSPDPLWLAGLYDGADGDDLINGANHLGSLGTPPLLPVDLSVRRCWAAPDDGGARAPLKTGCSVRAPPIHRSALRVPRPGAPYLRQLPASPLIFAPLFAVAGLAIRVGHPRRSRMTRIRRLARGVRPCRSRVTWVIPRTDIREGGL